MLNHTPETVQSHSSVSQLAHVSFTSLSATHLIVRSGLVCGPVRRRVASARAAYPAAARRSWCLSTYLSVSGESKAVLC